MNNLRYVFKKRGSKPDMTVLKNQFQKIYQANDYAIFDTFWQNEGLRRTLFENSDEDDKEAAFADFQALVNTTSSAIYNFITVN